MPGVEHRSVTPLLQVFRDVCRGRRIVESLRYTDGLAARTQPPPQITGGPYHKTSKVYYYTRDARRLVQPPTQVYSPQQIEAGKIDVSKLKLTGSKKLQVADK